jgi:hypothetical protein
MLHVDAIKYRLTAEHWFSIACAVDDPDVRRQSLDAALYWFRLAERMEIQPNHATYFWGDQFQSHMANCKGCGGTYDPAKPLKVGGNRSVGRPALLCAQPAES